MTGKSTWELKYQAVPGSVSLLDAEITLNKLWTVCTPIICRELFLDTRCTGFSPLLACYALVVLGPLLGGLRPPRVLGLFRRWGTCLASLVRGYYGLCLLGWAGCAGGGADRVCGGAGVPRGGGLGARRCVLVGKLVVVAL